MFLAVDGPRMLGLANPAGESTDCPHLVLKVDGGASTVDEEGGAIITKEEKLHLGAKFLSSIVSAAAHIKENQEDTKNVIGDGKHVMFLRNMANPEEITLDKEMINFVAERLIAEGGSHLLDLINGSRAPPALRGNKRHLASSSDEDQENLEARFIALYLRLMQKQISFKEASESYKTDNQNGGKGRLLQSMVGTLLGKTVNKKS